MWRIHQSPRAAKVTVMITYSDLVQRLHRLEKHFGGNCVAPVPPSLTGLVSGGYPNRQFFALDWETRDIEDPLPIVVVVGANYTQQLGYTASVLPGPNPKALLLSGPFVEDGGGAIRAARTKIARLASEHGQPRFHLVFTNLVEWITKERWKDYGLGDRRVLVSTSYPRAHVAALKASVGTNVLAWIGHTKSLHRDFADLFTSLGVPVGPARWGSNNLSIGAPNFVSI